MRFHTALGSLILLAAAPAANAQAYPFYLDVDICWSQPGNFANRGTQCDPALAPYGSEEVVFRVDAGGALTRCIPDYYGGPGWLFYGGTWSKTNNQVTMFDAFSGNYLVGALAGGGTSGGVVVDYAGLATPVQSQQAAWDGTKAGQQVWDACVNGAPPIVNWPSDGWYDGFESFPPSLPCPDITATGVYLGLGDDSSAVAYLGSPFTYYGTPYYEVWVNNNGNLTFGGASSTYTNVSLQNDGTERIAPFWDDLIQSYTYGGAGVFYEAIPGGTAFQWNISHYSGDFVPYDIRAVLWDSGQITTCIASGSAGDYSFDFGASATAGLGSGAAGSFLQYSYNSATLVDGLVLDYLPVP